MVMCTLIQKLDFVDRIVIYSVCLTITSVWLLLNTINQIVHILIVFEKNIVTVRQRVSI